MRFSQHAGLFVVLAGEVFKKNQTRRFPLNPGFLKITRNKEFLLCGGQETRESSSAAQKIPWPSRLPETTGQVHQTQICSQDSCDTLSDPLLVEKHGEHQFNDCGGGTASADGDSGYDLLLRSARFAAE